MAYIVCAAGASAQTFQTVRGTVCESATGAPIEFATVMVANAELPIGTTTDSIGGFSMKVPVGRHNIQVSYLGYEPVILKEVLVGSSKEVVLNIGMTESPTNLNEVVVTPHINKAEPLNSMAVTGGRMLSTEEASRYAGGMDDPARLVSAFAGVSSNVGNNGIVVRGNAPRSLQWRLEDVEIPNPNHFADVTTFGGGGFTSLSSFVLGNSDFFTGAFPAEYSNALSGVFDMNMRNGNNQKWEHAFKVGVLGIDASSEGPLRKDITAHTLSTTVIQRSRCCHRFCRRMPTVQTIRTCHSNSSFRQRKPASSPCGEQDLSTSREQRWKRTATSGSMTRTWRIRT